MAVLRPQPLTKAVFAPFGEVLEIEDAESFVIKDGRATRIHDLAAMFERHPLGSQAFYPLSGRPWLVVVAADDAGRPGEIAAFLASGTQGVNYARSVWHHPLLVLGDDADFLVVDRVGDGDNLQEFQMERSYRLER